MTKGIKYHVLVLTSWTMWTMADSKNTTMKTTAAGIEGS